MANNSDTQQLPEAVDQPIEETNSRTGAQNGRNKETDQNGQQNGNAAATSKPQGQKEAGTETKTPSKLKQWWTKADLDLGTILMMFKGSVAPIIAIAFYQSTAVAQLYGNIGYLVAIVTVLSIPIMPRAKFLQTVILNTIAICLGACISLLGIWSAVQARLNTSAPPHQGYNSSQAVVSGIFLLWAIWFGNTLRAKIPALQFPVIIFSIFTNVAFTYGGIFPTVSAALSFVRTLLVAFLTAFGIATGVNLFVIPVSSRQIVFKEQAGYIALLRKTIKAEVSYLQSLESSDMFSNGQEDGVGQTGSSTNGGKMKKKQKESKQSSSAKSQTPQAAALKGTIEALIALHGKLNGDLPFAKREMAYGKLCAKDIQEIYTKLRAILIPLIGISTITDIFERIAERRGWAECPNTKHDKFEAWEQADYETKAEEMRTWNEIMKALHEPFAIATASMDEALEHISVTLELTPAPKKAKKSDVEADGGDIKPGHPEFSKHLKEKMSAFYRSRGVAIKTWAKEKGISQEEFDGERPTDPSTWTKLQEKHRRDQQQLYLILYLEHLLFSAGTAIASLADFADKKVADGTMSKKRLLLPGVKRVKKWILGIAKEDQNVDTETPDSLEAGTHNIYMGAGFSEKKDPEHLPAKNTWEKMGNAIRAFPRFMGSTESAFGFRVALATFTIAILAFLRDTQRFFVENRLVWAMIIIAIGMTITSGQSIFGFIGRVAGTTLAMVVSIVIWYIVDERTPGIIVMLWFVIFIEMYFFIKIPRLLPVFLVTIVTQILIIGYELQVDKVGIEVAEASGQRYLPIYELAPYRLACVAAGSFVAFFWTIFPYPITDRSWLRKDLGSTLYLLANYYSIVHSTIKSRLHHTQGDMNSKHSPGRRLEKARLKVFSKLLMLLPSLQMHADWQKFELSIGGKFPKEPYEKILKSTRNILNYLTLMSYATTSFHEDSNDDLNISGDDHNTRLKWLHDMIALSDKVRTTSHQITSTLSLLSASVRTGSALPPYIQLPEPYHLSRRLEELDKGILSAKHIAEPGYSAYAVIQVASSMLGDDLRRLVDHVSELVGETNFEFGVVGSDETLTSDTVGVVGRNGNGKGKRE